MIHNRTDTSTSNNDDNSSNDRTLVNIIELYVNTRFMLIVTIISTIISLFFIWFRLAFSFEADCISQWNRSSDGLPSYLIALKFSLTAMITILMQHIYYFRLFKSASDNDIIAVCKLTISLVVPSLLGAGIGSGIGGGIGCLIGIIIGAGIGFALRNIWGEEQQQKNTSNTKNSHLFLWLSQFIYLSIYILTGIVTFAVASSSSRFGTYLNLFQGKYKSSLYITNLL